jgi:hypothetical protein
VLPNAEKSVSFPEPPCRCRTNAQPRLFEVQASTWRLDIVEESLNTVEKFVAAVEHQPSIAAVAPTPVRLDEFVG